MVLNKNSYSKPVVFAPIISVYKTFAVAKTRSDNAL